MKELVARRIFRLVLVFLYLHMIFLDNQQFNLYAFILLAVTALEASMEKYRVCIIWILIAGYTLFLNFHIDHLCVILAMASGLLNLIAMAFNQYRMPIVNLKEMIEVPNSGQKAIFPFGYYYFDDDSIDFRHSYIDSDTRLFYLCDWIVIKNFGKVSIGDILLFLSGLISLVHFIF